MTEHKTAEERAREIVESLTAETAWPRCSGMLCALDDPEALAGLRGAITAEIAAAEREAIERGKAEALADIDKRGLCIVPKEEVDHVASE